jgi:hypothetical protein
MRCAKCKAELTPGERFCGECGQPVEAANVSLLVTEPELCPRCGAKPEAGERFCGSCGSPLGIVQPARKSHRLALMICGLLALSVAGAGVAYFVAGRVSNTPSEQPVAALTPNAKSSIAGQAQSPALALGQTVDGTDIKGPILRFFGLTAARVELCAQACTADANCRAYSYVKPGAYNAGDGPVCYLKSNVESTMPNHRVISGIVRGDSTRPNTAQSAGPNLQRPPPTATSALPPAPAASQPPSPPTRSAQLPVPQNPAFEYDTDRPGNDYRNFDLSPADPALCAAQCEREGRCMAWTYVKPGVQGPNAKCWLKDRIPNPVRNASFAVSGVTRYPVPPASPPPTAYPVPTPQPTIPIQQTATPGPVFEYNIDRPGSDYRNFELATADPGLCAAQCAREEKCRAWTYVIPGVQGVNARCWLKHSIPNPVPNARFAVSGVTRPGVAAPMPGGSPQTANLGSFAGRWNTGDWGITTFSQTGNQVTGIFSARADGRIWGTAQGRVLTGQYTFSNTNCRFRVELSADGSQFSGPAECEGWGGKYVGKRIN